MLQLRTLIHFFEVIRRKYNVKLYYYEYEFEEYENIHMETIYVSIYLKKI